MVEKWNVETIGPSGIAGEEEVIRDRHLDYFLELSRQFEPALHGADQLAWRPGITPGGGTTAVSTLPRCVPNSTRASGPGCG